MYTTTTLTKQLAWPKLAAKPCNFGMDSESFLYKDSTQKPSTRLSSVK